ncbi:MAG: ribbon-helix-helix domain-containing protein [Crenarchaeota archaeon]|nr:ribbon-helix-helix domain-containing protein [Thermoproteota archaeon]MCR8454068.1 ribbon-helix-helix domain-containing protein [Thermoproteota archaeon]MCR8462945.1 ribbon-helix-helix domain-containing protein [Thermoproteota archaeon]MCR8471140.1 ribbon-helix-helix domain-containing protein [Thermoproteota archaeon]MCR8473175.1 ribbon-helix-helix domain-containing protein [Thermoproteota archaeon]
MAKRKLTVTISDEILKSAKEKAASLGLSLSKIIENALSYFIKPKFFCFVCGTKFDGTESNLCPKCGWYKCSNCSACACSLSEESAKVAFYMRKTLIDMFSNPEV